jgi:hypothetical protein
MVELVTGSGYRGEAELTCLLLVILAGLCTAVAIVLWRSVSASFKFVQVKKFSNNL